jgi:hypothetical protein
MKEKEDGLCEWASVDHANDPTRFVNYLDTATTIDSFRLINAKLIL